VLALVLLVSCKKDKPITLEIYDTYESDVSATEEAPVTSEVPDFEGNYGMWSGKFEADVVNHDNPGVYSEMNVFSIVVKSIDGDQVEGYSVSAGNVRPFSGEVIEKRRDGLYIVAEEPGDHKYDGVFKFTISNDKRNVNGKWYSNRKDLPVLSRKFSIEKKNFTYNPKVMLKEYDEDGDESGTVDWINERKKVSTTYDGEEYASIVHRAASEEIYSINGSTRKLSEMELKNLRKLDLEIIRNTIYARHGYTFANRGARQFFDYVEWYIPLYANVEDKLTDIEKENIKLIKRLEKYAEDYYQQYGR